MQFQLDELRIIKGNLEESTKKVQFYYDLTITVVSIVVITLISFSNNFYIVGLASLIILLFIFLSQRIKSKMEPKVEQVERSLSKKRLIMLSCIVYYSEGVIEVDLVKKVLNYFVNSYNY